MGQYLFSQTKYHILTCFKVDSKHLNHSDKNFTPKLLNKVMYIAISIIIVVKQLLLLSEFDTTYHVQDISTSLLFLI